MGSSKSMGSTNLVKISGKDVILQKKDSLRSKMFTSITKHFKTAADDDCSTCSTDVDSIGIQKFVSFNEKVVVHRTMPLTRYTPEEIEACWYTREERMAIRQQCSKQIRKLNDGEQLLDKKYCARGLEAATYVGMQSRRQNRSLAYKVVLGLQTRQKQVSVYDDESIAQSYRRVSSSCQLWANVVGSRDQRAADLYLER